MTASATTDDLETTATSAAGEPWLGFRHADDPRVYAERALHKGELIERAPVLLVPRGQMADFQRSHLSRYCCEWDDGYALVLGLGPVYSSSGEPNAGLQRNVPALSVDVLALRDIAAGEPIVVADGDGGSSFWMAERNVPLWGHAVRPGRSGRKGASPEERRRACREAEAQALAQQARRNAEPRHIPLQPRTLILTRGVELELVPIPFGVFWVGGEEDDPDVYTLDKPRHLRFLDDYWIGRHPVTVRQFAAFVHATDYRTTAESQGSGWVWTPTGWEHIRGADWRRPGGPGSDVARRADHPVTLVSWDDALAFCDWVSCLTGVKLSLPGELEWEKAARGSDGRPWPWGAELPSPGLCNCLGMIGNTTPVTRYSPGGDSPWHCADMAGNVLEWTDSLVRAYPFEDDEQRGWPDQRILRGGAFHQGRRPLRCSARAWADRGQCLNCNGFRLKASWEKQPW